MTELLVDCAARVVAGMATGVMVSVGLVATVVPPFRKMIVSHSRAEFEKMSREKSFKSVIDEAALMEVAFSSLHGLRAFAGTFIRHQYHDFSCWFRVGHKAPNLEVVTRSGEVKALHSFAPKQGLLLLNIGSAT